MEVLEVYSFSTPDSGLDLQNNYIVALMYSNGKRTLKTVLCGLTTAMVCADNAFLVGPREGSTILANNACVSTIRAFLQMQSSVRKIQYRMTQHYAVVWPFSELKMNLAKASNEEIVRLI